jgi:hypothetical protein
MTMLTLLVDCHQCAQEFPTEVVLGEKGARGRLLDGMLYVCPHCGARDPYFPAEHHLPQAQGYAMARSPGPRWLRPVRTSAEGIQ